jgi:hypothetical protein
MIRARKEVRWSIRDKGIEWHLLFDFLNRVIIIEMKFG